MFVSDAHCNEHDVTREFTDGGPRRCTKRRPLKTHNQDKRHAKVKTLALAGSSGFLPSVRKSSLAGKSEVVLCSSNVHN